MPFTCIIVHSHHAIQSGERPLLPPERCLRRFERGRRSLFSCCPCAISTALVIILAAVCYARTLCCLSSRQPAAKAGHRQAVSGLPGTGATWTLPRPDAHPDILNCWVFSDTAPQTNGCAYHGHPHGPPCALDPASGEGEGARPTRAQHARSLALALAFTFDIQFHGPYTRAR